jgi:multicomponent Na+:H+ antiporter subunit G
MIMAATEAVSGGGLDILGVLRSGLAVISILAGLFFVLGGTLGVLRLPDPRLHAAGITDTLGAELIILGLVIQSGFSLLSLKLLLVALFLLLTSPTATHAVAHAAYKAGLKPLTGKYKAPSLEELAVASEKDTR